MLTEIFEPQPERLPKEKAQELGYCNFLCLNGFGDQCRLEESNYCLATKTDRERWERNITTLYKNSIQATGKRTRKH